MTDPKILTDPGLKELAQHVEAIAAGRVIVHRTPAPPPETAPPPESRPPWFVPPIRVIPWERT